LAEDQEKWKREKVYSVPNGDRWYRNGVVRNTSPFFIGAKIYVIVKTTVCRQGKAPG